MFFYICRYIECIKMMKNVFIVLIAVLSVATATAQKKDKIKGSKTISVTQRELEEFNSIEVEDNIEVFLIKGSEQKFEIEADDNLHESITAEVHGGNLRITTNKTIKSAKKISVRITYDDALKNIVAKHETTLNALKPLELDSISIKNLDYSKSFLNVKARSFKLEMDDKAEGEINVEASKTEIILSKNAELEALIAVPDFKLDMYQRATATIEGDAATAQIRLDNNAELFAKKFTVKNMQLLAEGYCKNQVKVSEKLNLSANGKSETELYDMPKIEISVFADNAILRKEE